MTFPTTITGVAFDLDGTLVDSAADIAGAVNVMLRGHGVAPQSTEYVERFIGEGSRELIAGVYRGLGVSVHGDRLDDDVAAYLAAYDDAPVVDSTLYADAEAALRSLHAAGVTLGICTNKNQHMAELVLETFGLAELFSAVVGGDVLGLRKPHPGHVLTTLEKMGTPVQQALFVGDTAFDVLAGRQAGVATAVVGWARPDVGAGLPRLHRFAEIPTPS